MFKFLKFPLCPDEGREQEFVYINPDAVTHVLPILKARHKSPHAYICFMGADNHVEVAMTPEDVVHHLKLFQNYGSD